jgi:hypothetical protein
MGERRIRGREGEGEEEEEEGEEDEEEEEEGERSILMPVHFIMLSAYLSALALTTISHTANVNQEIRIWIDRWRACA